MSKSGNQVNLLATFTMQDFYAGQFARIKAF